MLSSPGPQGVASAGARRHFGQLRLGGGKKDIFIATHNTTRQRAFPRARASLPHNDDDVPRPQLLHIDRQPARHHRLQVAVVVRVHLAPLIRPRPRRWLDDPSAGGDRSLDRDDQAFSNLDGGGRRHRGVDVRGARVVL